MKNLRVKRNGLGLLLVLALLLGMLSACTKNATENTQPKNSGETTQEIASTDKLVDYEEQAEYLSVFFGIDADSAWDADRFSEALHTVGGENAVAVEGELTALSAMQAAVTSAAYDELARSYPEEKVAQRLALYDVTPSDDATVNAYLACGLDAQLFDAQQASAAIGGDALSRELAAQLLMTVAEANGNTRNYLGYSNDAEIDARLAHMWESFIMFDDAQLTELGRSMVEQQITTGYNLKNTAYDARFLPSLTIQYGHSDLKHAHQLLALLNSEDIVAKVQLEPKISVFQYLLDWGPVPEPTATYEVRQFGDDLYLAFAVEYDLQLEFASEEDMLRFNEVILTYAKKWEGNEDAQGLIYGAWWQPLYSTTRADMPTDAYYVMYDCVVANDGYEIHSFSLEELILETNGMESKTITRYCNQAFYNYLTGEDFQ